MKKTIPFGWDITSKKYVGAGSVPNGVGCNCECPACHKPLEAVHGPQRGNYFRHAKYSTCNGGLETIYHKVAKQILQEASEVSQFPGRNFQYDICSVEKVLHGKRPDVYLFNSTANKGLVVEIYYSNKKDQETINIFKENGEDILEINISEMKTITKTYGEFREFVLMTAPREMKALYSIKKEKDGNALGQILLWAITAISALLLFKKLFSRSSNRSLFRR